MERVGTIIGLIFVVTVFIGLCIAMVAGLLVLTVWLLGIL